MTNKLLIFLLIIFPVITFAQQDTTTVTKIGDEVPEFTFEKAKGEFAKISDYKGKLILINLFATWCPPCNIELPVMQEQVWDKYKNNPEFALFIFGREEGWDKLIPYKTKKGFTFPILPDLKREIFSKFAKMSIPRNILVDQDGKIIYQSIGYSTAEFAELVKLIDTKLSGSMKAR
jgi:peroxiredoxin